MLASGELTPILYEEKYEGLQSISRGLVDMEQRKMWGKGVVSIRPSRDAKL